MAWYSQGTQVVDFTENADGTIDFKTAGYFIPENANEWVSHVFKVAGEHGRHASPTGAPPATSRSATPAATRSTSTRSRCRRRPSRARDGEPLPGTPTFPSRDDGRGRGHRAAGCARLLASTASAPSRAAQACALLVRPREHERCDRAGLPPVHGSPIITKRVKTFRNRTRAFTWKRARARNGLLRGALHATVAPNGQKDIRQVALRRKRGRFFRLPAPSTGARRARSSSTTRSAARSSAGASAAAPGHVPARRERDRVGSRSSAATARSSKRSRRKSYARGKSTLKIRLGRKAKRGAYRVTLKANAPGHASRADAARALPVASRHR